MEAEESQMRALVSVKRLVEDTGQATGGPLYSDAEGSLGMKGDFHARHTDKRHLPRIR